MATLTADVEEFRSLARAVKDADKSLRAELFKAVAAAAKPVKADIARSAVETLPARGGLNRWVASAKVSVRQSYSGRNPGVTIKASKAKTGTRRIRTAQHDLIGPLAPGQTRTRTVRYRLAGTFGKDADLGAIDRGRVMHPLWGRAKRGGLAGGLAGPQMVRPGYFSDVMSGLVARRAEQNILAALDAWVAKLNAAADRAA